MRKARVAAPVRGLRCRAETGRALRAAGTERGSDRGDRQLLPAHRGEPAGARSRDPRHDAISRRTSICIPSCAALSTSGARPWTKGGSVDWAFGEALAFGTPGAGRDAGPAERAGFRPRHFQPAPPGVLRFGNRQALHSACSTSRRTRRGSTSIDSSLSEYAVLGFEFGYSVADPLTLVIWEAQFGDFANGAQIMIDQFIVSAESKWGQPSGLVHAAAARLRRPGSGAFERAHRTVPHAMRRKQHAGVPTCTTPAQYFHLLRRQMYGGHDRRGTRKPLVIFTPKSLLRHPRAVSTAPRVHGRRVPRRSWAIRRRSGQGHARGVLFRQGLLRPAGRARGAQGRSRRAGAGGAAISVRGRPGCATCWRGIP